MNKKFKKWRLERHVKKFGSKNNGYFNYFDCEWFKEHQSTLIWLLNHWLLKYWFRWILRIHKDCKFSEYIDKIEPHTYRIKIGKNTYRNDFRVHWKFSKRIYYAFCPIWWLAHFFDWVILDRQELVPNFGFDTLTLYPQAGSGGGNTTCDGVVGRKNVNETSATIIAGAGNAADNTTANEYPCGFVCSSTVNQFAHLLRGIFLFDTTSIPLGSTVDSGTFSLYVNNYVTTIGDDVNWIVDVNPASNNVLVASDFNSFAKTTVLSTGNIPLNAPANNAYNALALNAMGLSNVTRNGVMKIGFISGWDRNNFFITAGTGDRRSLITVTYNDTVGWFNSGTIANAIDGVTNSTAFGTSYNITLDGTQWIKFDYGAGNGVKITGFTFYSQYGWDKGTWKWQGSNDNSSWTDVSSNFVWYNGALSNISSSVAYRYYRMLSISGVVTNEACYEFEFTILGCGKWISTDSRSTLSTYMSDQTGTANDPKLVVTYRPPSKGVKTINGVAIENIKTINEHSATWIKKIDTLDFVQTLVPTWFGERGIIAGGWSYPTPAFENQNLIDYITISKLGNSTDFGDLSTARRNMGSCSNGSRGIFANGSPSTNTIEYITIATSGNTTDFGDTLDSTYSDLSGLSNTIRGVFGGGYYSGGSQWNTIQYITIATIGNSTDFGDLTTVRLYMGGCSNNTRGIWSGGATEYSAPVLTNIIDYITIATTGNAVDFGDTTEARKTQSFSNNIIGVSAGGLFSNVIDYVTISTLGNSADFGDLTQSIAYQAACSNAIRGISAGGTSATAYVNNIDYIVFSTRSNAIDFGDLTLGRCFLSGCSGN